MKPIPKIPRKQSALVLVPVKSAGMTVPMNCKVTQVRVLTLEEIGYSMLRINLDHFKKAGRKTHTIFKYDILELDDNDATKTRQYEEWGDLIALLVQAMKRLGVAKPVDACKDTVEKMGLPIHLPFSDDFWHYLKAVYMESFLNRKEIDPEDLILFPAVENWDTEQYDHVFVDRELDLFPIQKQLISKLCVREENIRWVW